MNPPIRWYGGKTSHAQWILAVMNRYQFCSYIEPFGGSGAVLFAKPASPIEVYNDLHGDVVNMYEVIRNPKTFRKFKRFVTLTPFSLRALHKRAGLCQSCYKNSEPTRRMSLQHVRRRTTISTSSQRCSMANLSKSF